MGLNEHGTLEIIDLQPSPGQKDIIPGWDGRTLWATKVNPLRDIIHAPTPEKFSENMFSEFIGKCHYFDPEKPVKPLVGGHYFTLKSSPDEQPAKVHSVVPIKDQRIKFLRVYDINDNIIWEVTILANDYGINNIANQGAKVALHLDNYGRAFIYNRNSIIWCTCPYCTFWLTSYPTPDPESIQNIAHIDKYNYGLYFHDEQLDIPFHFAFPVRKQTPICIMTYSFMSSISVGFFNPTHSGVKIYPFDEFWDNLCKHTYIKANLGNEMVVPRRVSWPSVTTPPAGGTVMALLASAFGQQDSASIAESKAPAASAGQMALPVPGLPERRNPESAESLESLLSRSD